MKAIILAAGLGSRLRPLTDKVPKALVKVGNKPLLLHAVEKMIGAGVSEIVVNIHHHGGKMRKYIEQLDFPGVKFYISDETNELLDTGGALKKAGPLLQGSAPFFIYNVDVLTDIDLKDMLANHQKFQPLATLAVTRRQSSRYFLWKNGQLAGWTNKNTGEQLWCQHKAGINRTEPLAFSGIHLADPALLRLITETGRFSVKDLYLRLACNYRIMPYLHDHRFWADTGTPEKLRQAGAMLKGMPTDPNAT
ncbi:MAG: nucleotidyltransferase family protein [Bacteroidales bacterium]